jgi:small subunit ribosomal protein S2
MNRYIFESKKGIDIINLDESKRCLDRALEALRKCVAKGGRIMFEEVAPIVEETAKRCG